MKQREAGERLALRVTEAAEAVGVSRAQMYRVLAKGEIQTVRIGGARRIVAESLREWVKRKSEEQAY